MGQRQPEKSPPVDWDGVRRRIEEAQSAVKRGWAPSPGEKKRILKERARALAAETGNEDTPEECISVLEFLLSSEHYGIESSYVREVYPVKGLTPLPCTPPFIIGIINVRGRILSVMDVKIFFDLPGTPPAGPCKVVIVRMGEVELGILADKVMGVRPVPLKEVQQSLPSLTDIREDFLGGVTRDRLVLLDMKKVLSDKRIVVSEEVYM